MKQSKVFAEGFCFYKIFIFFVLGCVIGSFYEEVIFFFQTKEWTVRHDLIYGPFSSLYGFGLVIFLLLLGPKNEERGFFKTFIYASFIGGVTEYMAGFISDIFFHIKFWDYSGMFLNIHGRTTIIYALTWGLFATVFLKWIYPFLSKLIENIPVNIGRLVCILLLIFFIFDLFVSYGAFFRMLSRQKGKEAKTFIGEIYDKVYDNDFMYKKFPILKGKL